MTDTPDAASILFPSEVRTSSAPPEWFTVQRNAAEARLAGIGHGDKLDAQAAAMFPNEGPKSEAPRPAGDDADDTAKVLFKDDVFGEGDVSAYEQTVGGELDTAVLDAIKNGEPERADDLHVAIDGLTQNFAKAGTDREEITEAFRIVKGDSLELPSAEQIEADYQKRLQELPELGISHDDLRIARQLISDLETVSPGVKRTLEISGKGNDPKLIRMVVAEAKRRKYR